ncbi:Charged multivesicular body protein 1 [Diplonema papillatum]|nr:Charged multivesicular body protein 1 [Diplonema papillatum]
MSLEGMMKLQFNLKFASKQMAKSSKKCEKEEKEMKSKAKKAMEKGNMDGARIYAQNAIRKKNEALNFLRLSSRIDAVASRVDGAIKMRAVTKTMSSVVKGMDKALQSMQYDQIAAIMDRFEQQFEDIDVIADYTEEKMGQTSALTTPEGEVTNLLSQIADENNLDFSAQLPGVPAKADSLSQVDELSARLAKLKEVKA